MSLLLKYQWPGNIRELENVIQRGMVLADGAAITLEHIPPTISKNERYDCSDLVQYDGFSIKSAQKAMEANMIKKALEETEGNKSKAAVLLEISYPSLLSKIKEYSL